MLQNHACNLQCYLAFYQFNLHIAEDSFQIKSSKWWHIFIILQCFVKESCIFPMFNWYLTKHMFRRYQVHMASYQTYNQMGHMFNIFIHFLIIGAYLPGICSILRSIFRRLIKWISTVHTGISLRAINLVGRAYVVGICSRVCIRHS